MTRKQQHPVLEYSGVPLDLILDNTNEFRPILHTLIDPNTRMIAHGWITQERQSNPLAEVPRHRWNAPNPPTTVKE